MVVALTLSLLVYANATGDLTLRRGEFDSHMKIGNLVSEFGGVYPFFQVVPVAVAALTHSAWAGAGACGFSAVALAAYSVSGKDIVDRYPMPQGIRLAALSYVTVSPVFGYVTELTLGTTAYWVGVNLVGPG